MSPRARYGAPFPNGNEDLELLRIQRDILTSRIQLVVQLINREHTELCDETKNPCILCQVRTILNR